MADSRAHRLLVRLCWACCLLAALPLPCEADSIFLNAEGQRNIAVLRQRIAPAVILDDPIWKLPYIRCVIVGERPARSLTAPYHTLEGEPEYDVIAFDATGDRRSETVTISRAWINHIQSDLDSDLDVRALFSDRDERAGIPLGSRAYFAMARRAADPTGALGLWRNDMELPPEPKGVREGSVIRYLRDPPLKHDIVAWRARQEARNDAMGQEMLDKRLPMEHRVAWEILSDHVTGDLIDAIARERTYRVSRTGFDRTAMSMLVFMLDLATLDDGKREAKDTPAQAIAHLGRSALDKAAITIVLATPSLPGDEQPPELALLFREYWQTLWPSGIVRRLPPAAERPRIAAEYDAMFERFMAERRAACGVTVPFCLDTSQRAAVAIDALIASEGMFADRQHNSAKSLVQSAVDLHSTPQGPNPHKYDKVDLRDAAMKLLVHAINPPRGHDAASQQRRQAFATAARAALHNILILEEDVPGHHAAARKALAVGGWGSAEELTRLVEAVLGDAEGRAGQGEGFRGLATELIITLRVLTELGGSRVPHERSTAARILNRVEEMRTRVKERLNTDGEKIFLEIWDSLASSQPSR